jgi:RNA polymerase sigma factor (sigma-70 family)
VQPASFESYRGLLWNVLARMARTGYVVQPDDGQDLFQDFFLNEWPKVLSHFDPHKGRFEPYLARAFFLFARPRIVALRRWQRRLRDTRLLAERFSGAEPRLEWEETERAREVLQSLSTPGREILRSFLSEPPASERSLAKQYRLTRYEVRQLLAEALGTVLAELGASSLPPREQRVAHELWRQGRSVQSTAAYLDLPVPEVQAIRNRLIAGLLGALRHKHKKEEPAVKHQEASALLRQALTRVNDTTVFIQLERHRDNIMRALEEEEFELSDNEWATLAKHGEWVAQVYRVLGGIEEISEKEKEIDRAVGMILAKEEEEIGRAFTQALLQNLDPCFRDWDEWFADVPQVDAEYQEELEALSAVQHGAPYSLGLVKYGMTPATFYQAARGIQLLANRLLHYAAQADHFVSGNDQVTAYIRWLKEHGESEGLPAVTLAIQPQDAHEPVVPKDLVLADIRGTPTCPPQAAAPLYDWMLRVACLRPFFFLGYEAKPSSENVIRLQQLTSQEEEGVYLRWQREAEQLMCMG